VFLWPTVYLITVGCLGAGLYATSLPGWDMGLAAVAFVACITIAGLWAVAFAIVADRGRMPGTTLVRWVGIPVIGYLCLGLAFLNVPGTVRFELSRPAMERTAQSTEGVNDKPGWIGLMPVSEVRHDPDGTTIFVVDNSSGWSACGFAYNPDRTPTDEADGLGGRIADAWWNWCVPYMD
jgi:hypothetical protein